MFSGKAVAGQTPISSVKLPLNLTQFPCLKALFRAKNRYNNPAVGTNDLNAVDDELDSGVAITQVTQGDGFTVETVNGHEYIVGTGTEGLLNPISLPNFGSNDFMILGITQTSAAAGGFTLGDIVNGVGFQLRHNASKAVLSAGNQIDFAEPSPVATTPYAVMAQAISPNGGGAGSGAAYIYDGSDDFHNIPGIVTGDISSSTGDWDFSTETDIVILNLFKWKDLYFLEFGDGLPGDEFINIMMAWMAANPDGGLYPGLKGRT